LPTIGGMIRFRLIPPVFRPIVYMVSLGLLNEIICYLFFFSSGNAVPNNIYLFIESLLFVWQFRLWKNVVWNKDIFLGLMLLLIAMWIVDYVVLGNIVRYSLLYPVTSSFILILLSVNQLNWLIVNDRSPIIKNPIFIICCAVILFFSYKIMAEVFYYYAPEQTIKKNIFVYEAYLNVVYNILLFIAILCIVPRKVFIKQLQ
jgi:hypothetical protein